MTRIASVTTHVISVPRPQPVWTAHEGLRAWSVILTEVNANSLAHTASWASASMPQMISPKRLTHSQVRGIGAPWISP